jgi:hypothetical protein
MSTRFRLNAVTLDTVEGPVHYEFPSDLTVLAGRTGVGKTTLLEAVKYGFGGDGMLAPVMVESVRDITLNVTIGQARLQIARSVDPRKSKIARVTDLVTRERLPDHHVDAGLPSLNALLLGALGFADDLKAAPRGTSSSAGTRISFADVFSFLYVPQADINRDIANSQDSYREPKRKVVFELLFGLTDPSILELRSKFNTMAGDVVRAETIRQTVLDFLRDSNTTTRADAQDALEEARRAEVAATHELRALREQIDPVSDRETQALRDLLNESERSLAAARAAVIDLVRRQAEYGGEQRRVRSDLDRLHRMRDAGARLANIEFAVCPRCMQSLTQRPVPDGACRVCLQDDPVQATEGIDQYEARQLADQLQEIGDQLVVIATQLEKTTQSVVDRERLVSDLTKQLEGRTAERITPRLQAFSDGSDRLATARAKQQQLEEVMRQWDRVDDLSGVVHRLRQERESIKTTIDESERTLAIWSQEVLDALNEEFQTTVDALGIPGVETASIHPTNYLPLLNGKPFKNFSRGGGIVTATQVAYWTSVIAVALSLHENVPYPAFLLLDSPRLALNTSEELSAALYRRLVALADASRGRLQVIIADNELPRDYRRDYTQIDFTYESPTVPTIRHPGPSAVRTIDNLAAEERE